MPVCAVDVVICRGGRALLLRRNDEPARRQWWLPGGRVLKNETLRHAAFRKALEETGLRVTLRGVIDVYEIRFRRGPFAGLRSGVHNVAVCFRAAPADARPRVRLDATHSDYRWAPMGAADLHPYVRQLLRDARLFGLSGRLIRSPKRTGTTPAGHAGRSRART